MTVRLHAWRMLPISLRSPDWHADAEQWIARSQSQGYRSCFCVARVHCGMGFMSI
jgi:hypothetical protein